MRLLVALPALALASLLSTPRAQACWDGYSASIGNVTIRVATDDDWSPPTIREVALWGTRLQALLPAGTGFTSELGAVSFCKEDADGDCVTTTDDLPWSDDELPALFGKAAVFTHASSAEIRRIMAINVVPLTVQVFAGKSERRAEALAASINDGPAGEFGFFVAGGFPAYNATTHVISGKDARGRVVHRVFMGAFLSRADAEAASVRLRKSLGIKGLVRPL